MVHITCGIVAELSHNNICTAVTRLERGKRRVLRGKTAGRYLLLAMMLVTNAAFRQPDFGARIHLETSHCIRRGCGREEEPAIH